jgi:LysR family nitrogen assimilation transcriptional regulator
MILNLSSIGTFTRVAELGSFSKAAVSLKIAQPSISRIISELESTIGGELFYRTGRGAKLSELGEMLLPRAQALLQTAEQLETDAAGFGRAPVGNVSVASLPSLTQPLASTLYNYVREHTPGIKLRLIEGFSDQVERWVAEGAVDIGLLSKYKNVLASRDDVLFRADLMLVRAGNVASGPKVVQFADLDGLPMVLPSSTNGLRIVLEETARRHKIKLNVVVEAESLVAQREIVIKCGCNSVMARQALDEIGPGQSLVGSRINEAGLERYVVAATTQQRPLSKAARVVLQAIRHTLGAKKPIASLKDLAATLAGASRSPDAGEE